MIDKLNFLIENKSELAGIMSTLLVQTKRYTGEYRVFHELVGKLAECNQGEIVKLKEIRDELYKLHP